MDMLFLIFCVISSFNGNTGILSTGGRYFLVTFQDNKVIEGKPPKEQCITLTTFLNSDVSVDVRSLSPSHNYTTNMTITNTSGKYICLDSPLKLEGTGISRRVVRVISDKNINVVVNEIEIHSKDSYLAIPVEEFGTEYYVISYSSQSQFSITASDNETMVNIEFPSRVNTSLNYRVEYHGVTIVNPTNINLLLQEYEVFQLQTTDLTGVFVSSNKPIAVTSGNRKIIIGESETADHLVQQMPPVDTWGRRFISVPSPEKVTVDIYRILTSGPNTTVTIGTDFYTLDKEGDWFEVEVSASLPVEIQSNAAILVVKLVTNTGDTDPCMMLIVPVRQWHYEYTFSFPIGQGYLLISIETSFRTNLLLKPEPTDTLMWTEVDNTSISVGYVLLTNDFYTVKSTTANVVFAAYIHQTAYRNAFCSPVGMKLEKINANWNHTRSISEICGSTMTSTTSIATTPAATPGASDNPTTTSVSASTTSFSNTADSTDIISTLNETSTIATTADSLKEFKTTVDVASICNTADTTSMVSTVNERSTYPTTTEGLKEFNEKTDNTSTNGNCSCQHDEFHTISNISDEDIRVIITRLKHHLQILANQTSRAIRMKISVPDYRPSATAFGIAGGSMLFISVAITCLSDLPHMLRHLRLGFRKQGSTMTLVP